VKRTLRLLVSVRAAGLIGFPGFTFTVLARLALMMAAGLALMMLAGRAVRYVRRRRENTAEGVIAIVSMRGKVPTQGSVWPALAAGRVSYPVQGRRLLIPVKLVEPREEPLLGFGWLSVEPPEGHRVIEARVM
jgi:hypothetical protein